MKYILISLFSLSLLAFQNNYDFSKLVKIDDYFDYSEKLQNRKELSLVIFNEARCFDINNSNCYRYERMLNEISSKLKANYPGLEIFYIDQLRLDLSSELGVYKSGTLLLLDGQRLDFIDKPYIFSRVDNRLWLNQTLDLLSNIVL